MKNRYSFKTDDAGQPTILDKKDKKKVHALVPVLCLLIAVLIWLYVAGNDVGTTKTFVVPVTVENEAVLSQSTGMRVWFSETPFVIVVLRGRSVFLDKVSEDNIVAVMNVETIHAQGTFTIDVDVRLDGVSKSVTVDGTNVQTISVLADYAMNKDVPLSVTLLAPSAASRQLKATVAPDVLTITGPQSIVNTIGAGYVPVYAEVSEGQVLTDRMVTFLDESGVVINNVFLSGVTYPSFAVTVIGDTIDE